MAFVLVLARPEQRIHPAQCPRGRNPRWNPAPAAPQQAVADPSQQVFDAIDRAVAVVQGQGVEIPKEALDFFNATKGTHLDPAVVNFYEANKGLLPS